MPLSIDNDFVVVNAGLKSEGVIPLQQFAADGEIKIGDEVVLFGTQQSDEISIGDVAKWGDSSVYKVAIKMNTLLPRIYI